MTTNIDLVKSVYASFARGDLPTVLSAMDPEITWQTPTTLPWSAGDYHGRLAVQDYLTSFTGALTDPVIAPEEFLDAGEHVVVHGQERAAAAATGRRFTVRFTHTWTLRDGLVTRMRGIVDTAAVRDCFTAEAARP